MERYSCSSESRDADDVMAGEMWQLSQTVVGKAIVEGDPYEVKRLIEGGENVMFKDRKGNTFLHYICTMHKPYVLNVLCAAAVPINAQNTHGNTALHVTALHEECCHVPDLMQCGLNPYIRNRGGKLASDIACRNKLWLDLYRKYEPSLMHAVANHDIEAVTYLFGCWSAVHLPIDIHNGFNLRNYAASLTYHDIVSMIDKVRFSLMAVFSIKELDYKSLEYALSRGQEICDVNYLQKIKGHTPNHMLQHAIRLGDVKMIDMILEGGANLNVQVLVQEYIRGPLFFEVLRSDRKSNMEVTRRILQGDVDLNARDERGRSALVFCIDRRHGDVTMDLVDLLLEKEINIALRDNTGCTARDVASFARRHDIVTAIDKYVIEKIRTEDLTTLQTLAVHGYEHLFVNDIYRDAWIYAAGNESETVTEYLRKTQEYWEVGNQLHDLIEKGNVHEVKELLQSREDSDTLLQFRNKGGRGGLLEALLHGQLDVSRYLIAIDPGIAQRERDNSGRTALHYVESIHDGGVDEFRELVRGQLVINDVCGLSPLQLRAECKTFLEDERMKSYGMIREVHCMQKYEQLLSIIRSKHCKLKHFDKILKTIIYSVADFPQIFHPHGHPLVTGYRDLLLCAVDHRREEIARKLVNIRVDCSVTALYDAPDGSSRWMTAELRAKELEMDDLADYIASKGVRRNFKPKYAKCDLYPRSSGVGKS